MPKQRRSRADIRTRARERGSLAAVVAARREELSLRQDELADLADVSVRFVHAVESGRRSIGLDRLLAVLTALGLHLELERGLADEPVVAGAALADGYGLKPGGSADD
ncbi:hypothetical protein GCM10027273_14740 [Nocardioides pakistanensis]